jgi:hypothetical protein
MKTSSLEHKDSDVFWFRVGLLVEVEFVVFSLSKRMWVYISCLVSISPEPISNARMFIYFVHCILIIVYLSQGSVLGQMLIKHRPGISMT